MPTSEREKLDRLVRSVTDHRRSDKGNFRHKLPDMLYLSFAARLGGCQTRKEIIAYGEAHLEELQSEFGILDGGIPSEPTLHRMEKSIDGDEFSRLYSEFACAVAQECRPAASDEPMVFAVDGKAMRGTTQSNGRSPDIVSLYDTNSGITLDMEPCQEKSNEIKATPETLRRTPLPDGAVVTGDAMNCQKDIVDLIRANGYDYFIALKANQKEVRWSVEDELPGITPADEYHGDVECSHGRIHERHCRVFRDLSRISGIEKFRDVRAVVEVKTRTQEKATGKASSQTRYYITSHTGTARQQDYISRRHWAIENNLHWELDTLQKQDATKRKHTATARNTDIMQKVVHTILSYALRCRLPQQIACSKEKMKTKIKSLATLAKNNIAFALSLMAL